MQSIDNSGFWYSKKNLPVLNVAFHNFWDKDPVIWEHYFKTSHCFLWEKYDVRYNPTDPDVIFCSIFGDVLADSTWNVNIPRILLIHEPYIITRIEALDVYRKVISFTEGEDQPNNIRIPYWVYRIFDQYASHEYESDWSETDGSKSFNDFLFHDFEAMRNPKLIDERDRFCAFVQGKSIPWRDTVFGWLNAYKTVDSGGSLMPNLPDGPEKDYMAERLMGVNANRQKYNFFVKRRFSFAMENTMDLPGYTTEKIIDSYFAGTIPLYAGQMNPNDGFNPKAFINLYDFDSEDDFMAAIDRIDNNRHIEVDMRSQSLFTKYPDQFRLDAMLDTYTKVFER